jgi:hypothetical protein
LIRQEGTLRPLVGWRMQLTPRIPSWALDLAHGPRVSGDWWWPHACRYPWFSADAAEDLICDTSDDGLILSLSGVKVDRVKDIGPVLRNDTGSRYATGDDLVDTIRSWMEVKNRCIASHRSQGRYKSGESCDTAFRRTLIGDLVTREFPIRRASSADVGDVAGFIEGQRDSEIVESLRSMVVNQRFFVTASGLFGIGPAGVESSDDVWVLCGGRVPFVLRSVRGCGLYDGEVGMQARGYGLIGNSFVYGMMDGEAMALGRDKHVVYLI